ncbi:hypothetical protein [[Clostridium] innocuum]|nr:hypothetical protein [[Clostridium] innocuum]MCR0509081.1 hypothetical protein [[Clostridium] innocuum]MCR0586660.1 hypothetical protein [[Clostridium] innocuum]MCR0593813.1 hypothetical protein [[Clostridium] innocuum]
MERSNQVVPQMTLTASVLKSTDFWTGAFLYKGGGHCVTEHRGMAMA